MSERVEFTRVRLSPDSSSRSFILGLDGTDEPLHALWQSLAGVGRARLDAPVSVRDVVQLQGNLNLYAKKKKWSQEFHGGTGFGRQYSVQAGVPRFLARLLLLHREPVPRPICSRRLEWGPC